MPSRSARPVTAGMRTTAATCSGVRAIGPVPRRVRSPCRRRERRSNPRTAGATRNSSLSARADVHEELLGGVQRNRLRTKYAADPTKVDLRELGEYPDFDDKFVYARFSFTTPEYFGRPHHSWGGYVEDWNYPGDYAQGKIRLFGMGNNESLMGPSPQDNRFASCVSLVAMSSSGAHPYGHTHTRQLYDRAKIVIHECSEAEFDGDEIYAKNFEVTSSYLEPSTSYLLRSSSTTDPRTGRWTFTCRVVWSRAVPTTFPMQESSGEQSGVRLEPREQLPSLGLVRR